jgi:superfamily II DNA or RNA helicase
MQRMTDIGGGLLSLPCGFGKTVIALYIAYLLKVKTLVMVHKTFLQDQWIDRAKSFTTARMGLIRQSVIDITDKDIVIGMIQSITKRSYNPAIFSEFGLIIVDECHHIASRVFSQAMFKSGARYTLGLSATPERADGLTKVIHWHIGPMLYKKEGTNISHVSALKFNMIITDPLFVEKTQRYQGETLPSVPKMVSNLCQIVKRNQLIVDIIDILRKYTQRKILVLSGRISHLELLKNTIDQHIAIDTAENTLLPDEYHTCYYIGRNTQEERQIAEKTGDLIFASYEMAQEGLDIDRLDTIILATPKKNVVQAIGRVMRKATDNTPMIIDISDNLSVFFGQGFARKKLYQKNNYILCEFFVDDNSIMTATEYKQTSKKPIALTDAILRERSADVYMQTTHLDIPTECLFD